uniref:Kinesin-like protein KIF2A-like N-terminal domain-containing protein n=1 Tax=Anopheles epiroticus TaxID=199890 RepID=A0A182PI05_9DIPT
MLWFKKRLSTLFGGGKRAKREEGKGAASDDSRIHTAIVSRFHESTRSVTVEWYERGESKGKEIEIDMLLELNKNLQHQPQQQHAQHHQQHETEPPAEDVEMHKETPAPANLARQKRIKKNRGKSSVLLSAIMKSQCMARVQLMRL